MVDTKRIPLTTLFGSGVRWQPRLSRDGSQVTYLADDDAGVRQLWRTPLAGGPATAVTGGSRPVLDYVLLYPEAGRPQPVVVVHDDDGAETWSLHLTDLDGAQPSVLFAEPGVQAEVVAISPLEPGRVAFRANGRDPQLHDLWVHDLRTACSRMVCENPGVVEWIVDGRLRPVAGVRIEPDGGTSLVGVIGAGRRIARFGPADAMASQVLGVDAQGSSLYLADARGRDAAALTAVRVEDGAVTTVLAPGTHDVQALVTSPRTELPQWAVVEAERTELHVLDEDVRADLEHLARVDPGDLVLHGRDGLDAHWLVGYVSDTHSTRYYHHDRTARRTTFLFEENPALDTWALAPTMPVRLTARDGLALHAYLTRPRGSTNPVPMVVRVHGGPWERDVWGLDPEVQWLSGLGVACLQVNFRGSTGYGKRFLAAGNGEWGRRMQFDIEDAASEAVRRGWAESSRIGIWGGSYGGYASLMAATRPDLFACAVAIAPPIDLVHLVEAVPPYWFPLLAALHKAIGDPAIDADDMRQRSPLFLADRIRVPLMIVHGEQDPRVPAEDVQAFVKLLRAYGAEHRVLLFDDEGHGVIDQHNRLRLYREAEWFLEQHLLAPPAEPV